MTTNKQRIWRETKDYAGIILGLILYAIGYTCFMLPYQITTGGLAGISAIIFYASGIPVQYSYLSINAILLVVAVKELGFRFCMKTIIGILMLSFFMGAFQELIMDEQGKLPQILGDQAFMACVLGACLEGFGLAIVFLNNGSTGGTDIIAAIVNKYRDIALDACLCTAILS